MLDGCEIDGVDCFRDCFPLAAKEAHLFALRGEARFQISICAGRTHAGARQWEVCLAAAGTERLAGSPSRACGEEQ